MSTLSRVNWSSQQRFDTHHALMTEAFTAFDFRSIISALTGVDKAYILRGLQVVARSGLTVQVRVANCQIFNPQDANGSFYVGLSDDADQAVSLPSDQANVFVEATFSNQTQAPLATAYWDPLAQTGESATGDEFSASTDSQNVIILNISVNTVGFSSGAIPLFRASTSASAITSMIDCRPLYFRLGAGGSIPDPLNKYSWSATRSESVASGTGVGDAADSPWRSRDTSGSINDKAIGSFKEWVDAVMSRIAEGFGTSYWYGSGLATAPASGVSLNEVWFDTLGHNIQPEESSFIWKRVSGTLRLCGEGTTPLVSGSHHTGLIKWRSNNSKLEWQLGGTFHSSTSRNYLSGSVRFASPAPADKGNVYLLLEREVAKGSGAALSWADAGADTTGFNDLLSVSGSAGDFTGIALGDFIRKESEGYSRYYKVNKMSSGGTAYQLSVVGSMIADATIIALELELQNPADALVASSEPLRYFRSRYSDDDLYADEDVATNGYLYQSADFYWLGRRESDLFILRGYGTMQENEEVTTLNDSFITGGGDGGLVYDHAKEAYYDLTTGYDLKSGALPLLTIYRRKNNNTTDYPSSGDNSGALLSYTIAAPVGLLAVGECLWVRLSDTTSGALTNGSVVNTSDDLDNDDAVTNLWEIRSAADTPLRTYNNRNVFLVARRLLVDGQATLLFTDGSMIGEFGRLLNQNVEITNELKLTQRPNTSVLFIDDVNTGVVTDDVANFFYDKTAGTFGFRNFRATDGSIDVAAAGNVDFLTSMGARTLTVGGSATTTVFPGSVIVAGNTIAVQESQIQSRDKVITLGVGNPLDGGFDSGIEVADNSISGNTLEATIGSPDVTIVLASAPGYGLGDVIGVSTADSVGDITAGEISGQYTIVAALSAPGEATISGSTLTVRTATSAVSSDGPNATATTFSFKSEWSIKVSGADGGLTGFTSWRFTVKGNATTPTITPVASYGTVPTAHSVNMLATRIPFVNDDNAGPAGADSTLNFSADLTFDGTTLYVGGVAQIDGNLIPGADDTWDIGTALLQWNDLYIGPTGKIWAGGDTNLYRSAANHWKTDDEFETATNLFVGGYGQMAQQIGDPTAPASGNTKYWAKNDGFMYQRTPDGDIKLLTNINGNVFHEDVDVVAVPATNNEMAPATGPAVLTLPKDRRKLVGVTLLAEVTNTLNVVTVHKTNHGLTALDTVTVTTSVAIGGITAPQLSVVGAAVTVIDADTFSYVAGGSATSTASGYLDTVHAEATRYFMVGSRELEVYLNGQLLRDGIDYTEVGALDTLSNQINLLAGGSFVVGDTVSYRIDSNGGQYVVTAGGGGNTLQSAYLGGTTITVTIGFPVTIQRAGAYVAGDKLLFVDGDMDVSGVIDPKGITFTPQGSDPLDAAAYGLWTNAAFELIYKRAAGTALNLSTDYVRRDGTFVMTGALQMGGFRVTNLGTPTTGTDAATKDYVDSGVAKGSVPIGSVVPIFSNLTGTYAVPALGVVSAEGWMQCRGTAGQRTVPGAVSPTNPMGGQVIPDLSDSRFLMGSTTAGTSGGSNSITPDVSANTANFTSSVVSGATVANFSSTVSTTGGAATFNKNVMNTNQITHDHSTTLAYRAYWSTVTGGADNIIINDGGSSTFLGTTALQTVNSGLSAGTVNATINRYQVSSVTGSADATWNSATVSTTFTNPTISAASLDAAQTAHTHTTTAAALNAAQTAHDHAGVAFDNRPLYISVVYMMRVK